MPTWDQGGWMWSEACELLERAERLHRQFFRPGGTGGGPVWEPPVDVFETEREIWILVALPGVASDQVGVVFEGSALRVSGERRLPAEARGAAIHRLELPHGQFERRVALPAGRFEIRQRDLVDGCLRLVLVKRG